MIAGLDIEQHEGGFLLRWSDFTETDEGVSVNDRSLIITSDQELLSFVASHFGIAQRSAEQAAGVKPNRAGMN